MTSNSFYPDSASDSIWLDKWEDLTEINMEAVFDVFSKTLDQDIAQRGVSAGLTISVYAKVE